MESIWLTRKTEQAVRELLQHDLEALVVSDGPIDGVQVHTVPGLLETGWEPPRTMIVVGMSKIMTPENRVKYGQVLLRPREGMTRYVVDDKLFVAEPWRMFWHFYSVGRSDLWGYTDSFLAETKWRNAIELQELDPFGPGPVIRAVRAACKVDEPFRFPDISYYECGTSESTKQEYARLKASLFENERNISTIIRKLAAFASSECPKRSMPTPGNLFRRPPTKITYTDLAVDRWLVSRLQHVVNLTGYIAMEGTCVHG